MDGAPNADCTACSAAAKFDASRWNDGAVRLRKCEVSFQAVTGLNTMMPSLSIH
jgi:hypothetical protein